MYRRCELMTLTFDLETGVQCSTCVVEYASANFRDTTTIPFLIYGLLGMGVRRPNVTGRGETSSLSIDWLQQQVLLLRQAKLTNNCFVTTKFWTYKAIFENWA